MATKVRSSLTFKSASNVTARLLAPEKDGSDPSSLPQATDAGRKARAAKGQTASATTTPRSLAGRNAVSPVSELTSQTSPVTASSQRRRTRVGETDVLDAAALAAMAITSSTPAHGSHRPSMILGQPGISNSNPNGLSVAALIQDRPKRKECDAKSFSRFRREKERELQGAPIYDARSVRNGVLMTAFMPSVPSSLVGGADLIEGDGSSPPLMSRQLSESPGLESTDFNASTSSSPMPVPPALPPARSRPNTRQGLRQRQVPKRLEDALRAKEDDAPEELASSTEEVAFWEQMKQEFWKDFNEAGTSKKTRSEFEEWILNMEKNSEASTAIPIGSMFDDSEMALEEDTSSTMPAVVSRSRGKNDDSDFRTSHLGVIPRTSHDEYVSEYVRRCRESYYRPLGPRVATPRAGQDQLRHRAFQKMMAPQLVEPGVLQYRGWGLGSDRLDMLCEAKGPGISDCKQIDLSENRIEDRSVTVICGRLLPSVESLNLSKNQIGPLGIRYFAQGLEKFQKPAPLLELNLEGNRLGAPTVSGKSGGQTAGADVHERDLCSFVEALRRHCPELRALSLAQNQLGRLGHHLGQAIGNAISGMKSLCVLDLHWNSFHGSGAYHLLSGVYDNFLAGGKLSRLDLSWNRLGLLSPSGKGHVPAKVLSDLLHDSSTLFHLDISYNALNAEDCTRIAQGLRFNGSLFGLHIAGNEATVDELGFLIPFKATKLKPQTAGNAALPPVQSPGVSHGSVSAQPALPPLPAPLGGQVGMDRLAEVSEARISARRLHNSVPVTEEGGSYASTSKSNDGQTARLIRYSLSTRLTRSSMGATDDSWEKWDDDKHSVSLCKSFQSHPMDDVSFRAEKCWICDRWRSVQIVWTPAISGRLLAHEVKCVHAFVGSDDFSRPTVLKNVESKDGQVLRFAASRMVPPADEAHPLLVAFRVNGHFELARDMAIHYLPDPVDVATIPDSELASFGVNLEAFHDLEALEPLAAVMYVNEITAKDRRHLPLIITEDLVREGNLEVYPRCVEKGNKSGPPPWEKSQSALASMSSPDLGSYERMVVQDMKFCRIHKFAGENQVANVRSILSQYYPRLTALYKKESVFGEKHHVFGVSLHSLQGLMQKCDVFDRNFPPEHLSSLAFAAHSIDRKFADDIKVYSDTLLIRFQFIETFLRVAESKYVRSGKTDNLGEALSMLMQKILPSIEEIYDQIMSFHQDIMTEEIDLVFKTHMNILHAAFDAYAGSVAIPANIIYAATKKQRRLMTLPDFYAFLDDSDAFDARFVRRKGARAFGMASSWQVDEVSSGRHMQLSFVEFLAAVAAVVYEREHFTKTEFSDLLEEFILDNIQPAVDEHRATSLHGSKKLSTVKSIKKALMEVFATADEDGTGDLREREFSQVMRDPRIVEILGGRRFSPVEVMRIFSLIDDDRSGSLSFQEVAAGISSVLKLEQNAPRMRAFIKQELGIASADDYVPTVQVIQFLSKSTTQRKLMRAGVADPQKLKRMLLDMMQVGAGSYAAEKVDQLFKAWLAGSAAVREKAITEFCEYLTSNDVDGTKMHSASKFTEELLGLRNPKMIPRWRVLLQKVYEEADTEGTGHIGREELQTILNMPSTKARLQQVCIDVESVETLLGILDPDGNCDITEGLFLDGIETLIQICGSYENSRPKNRSSEVPKLKYSDVPKLRDAIKEKRLNPD